MWFGEGGGGEGGREIEFDRMPNAGGIMKEVMVVWEEWLPLAWLKGCRECWSSV